MSIRSEYSLTIQPNGPSHKEVADMIAGLSSRAKPGDPSFDRAAQMWESVIDGGCPYDWYDSEHHMRAVSRQWPDTMFTLRRHGMEGQGHSVGYFQNGQAQLDDQPQWGPAAFDPAKLH